MIKEFLNKAGRRRRNELSKEYGDQHRTFKGHMLSLGGQDAFLLEGTHVLDQRETLLPQIKQTLLVGHPDKLTLDLILTHGDSESFPKPNDVKVAFSPLADSAIQSKEQYDKRRGWVTISGSLKKLETLKSINAHLADIIAKKE